MHESNGYEERRLLDLQFIAKTLTDLSNTITSIRYYPKEPNKSFKLLKSAIARMLSFFNLVILKREVFRELQLLVHDRLQPSLQRLAIDYFRNIIENINEYNDLYALLDDDYSREVLLKVLKFRIILPFVGLARASNFVKFKYSYDKVSKLHTIVKGYIVKQGSPPLIRFNGYRIYTDPETFIEVFLVKIYEYKSIVKPERDDVVIDAGAYYGESSIWFASRVGKYGKVYALEPQKDVFKVLVKNILMNKLTNIIKPFNLGLWSKPSRATMYGKGGDATIIAHRYVYDKTESIDIKVTSLDYLLESGEIECVDFIKMDIEGAEMEALKGAKRTLHKCKPKLAVAAYHKPEDLIEIARLIKKIEPRYKIYLDHKWYDNRETILFAKLG